MIKWIFLIFFVVVSFIFPIVRFSIVRPYLFLWAIPDIFNFFRYKKYNNAPSGKLTCYAAHFGGGKTLSCVKRIRDYVKRFDNKKVYNFDTKKWDIQKVIVFSNVEIKDVNYIPLTSMDLFFEAANLDPIDGVKFSFIFFLDESSILLNSRNFKTNLTNPAVINSLLCSRHYSMNFFYSSQKFKLTDALLRSVTQSVIDCRKYWRFVILRHYNADSVENCDDIRLLRPLKTEVYFCDNKLFKSYDTYATVKSFINDKSYLSTNEIISNLGLSSHDVPDFSKKKRFRKKVS